MFFLILFVIIFLVLIYVNLEWFPYRAISPLRVVSTLTSSANSASSITPTASASVVSVSVPRYVLISGCDSGIGAELVFALNARGWHCIATCLTQEGSDELLKSVKDREIVHPVCCDITKPADVESVVVFVRNLLSSASTASIRHSLYAVICNAGIMDGSFFDWTSLDSFRRTMEVNFFGHAAFTKAFLPFLMENSEEHKFAANSSRIINIVSGASLIALPGTAAYNSSKYAFKGLSASLRRELSPFGISVCAVNPGGIQTPLLPLMPQRAKANWLALTEEVRQRYGEQYFQSRLKLIQMAPQAADSVQKVIESTLHALTASTPKTQYLPGIQAKVLQFMAYLPEPVADFIIAMTMQRQQPKIVKDVKAGKK